MDKRLFITAAVAKRTATQDFRMGTRCPKEERVGSKRKPGLPMGSEEKPVSKNQRCFKCTNGGIMDLLLIVGRR
jgi:hypothetical protein